MKKSEQPQGFGKYLMIERELREIPLNEVSSTTRIPVEVLKRIEEDRMEDLDQTYIKGYIKAYAECIGLDSNDVLLRYEEMFEKPNTSNLKKIKFLSMRRRSSLYGWTIFIIVSFIVLVLYIYIKS